MRQTSLYDVHLKLGAKMVPFAGWMMPVQYTGILEEHRTCRTSAALFDVSHMGEFEFRGTKAESFLNRMVTQDVSKMAIGQAIYTVLCNDRGGIVDDLVIYKLAREHFLMVVNASNVDQDWNHFKKALEPGVDMQNISDSTALISLQGPDSERILEQASDTRLGSLKYYHHIEATIDGTAVRLARTGYTGEDGFEIFTPWAQAPKIWDLLLNAKGYSARPVGLGARDTLRMEMKFSLYGNELTDTTTPLEAGLGWVVKFGKEFFVGKGPLMEQKNSGIPRKLVGFTMEGRSIPRKDFRIFRKGKEIGVVTSGTQSPTLGIPIGIGYVKTQHANIGNDIEIEIRGTQMPAKIVETPFYRRAKS